MAEARTTILAEAPFEEHDSSGVLRRAGVAVLAGALFLGPLAVGAVDYRVWACLWGLAALSLVIAMAVWVVEGRITLVAAPLPVILSVLALVAVLQLAPLPSKITSLAGVQYALHKMFAAAGRARMTLDPAATMKAFFKITLALMAALCASALPRTRAMLFALAGAVVASTVIACVVALVQEDGAGERIYGVLDLAADGYGQPLRSAVLDPSLSSGVGTMGEIELGEGVFYRRAVYAGDVFGPYANSNHFGGLLEISLPVMFSLLLALFGTRRCGWRDEGGLAMSSEGNLVLLLLFSMLVGVAALVYSHSFGAAGAAAAGLCTVAAVFAVPRRLWGRAAALLAVFAALGAALVFMLRPHLLGVLPGVLEAKFHGRARVWIAAARGALDFPLAGSGLGSFAAVMPHYESTEAKFLFAHNDYVQLALEAGLVVAAGLVPLAARQGRVLFEGALRRERDIYCAALSAGAAGAAAAVLFHSFFDSGMHAPANAVAFVVIVSVGTVAARAEKLGSEVVGFRHRVLLEGRRRVLAVCLLVFLLVCGAAAGLFRIVRAEQAKGAARRLIGRLEPASQAAPEGLARVHEAVSRAVRLLPWDGELRYQLAMLSALRAGLEKDEPAAQSLRREAVRETVAALRLCPAFTYYAMSAVTMGVNDNGLALKWPMSSFSYKKRLAWWLFDKAQDERAFAELRKGFELVAGDVNGLRGEADAAVAELLRRFGAYERMTGAVPDLFGAHLAFARALAAAGVKSAAATEYELAAERALGAARDDGLSERAVVEVGHALVDNGKRDKTGSLYAAVLDDRPRWHYLRLEYAQLLADAGRAEEARSQISIVIGSWTADWLRRDAVALGDRIADR